MPRPTLPGIQSHAGRTAIAILAALTLLALVAGVPIVLFILGGDLLPTHLPTLARLRTLLLHRDDTGRLFAQALLAIGWAAWAGLAAATLAETTGRLRGRRTVRLPGLSVQQRCIAALITTIALAFAAPSAAGAAPLGSPPAAAAASTHSATGTAEGSAAVAGHTGMVYVVRHGDYLGAIAQRFDGDFEGYRQLAAANHIGNPHLIHPGEKIALPAGARDRGPQAHATGTAVPATPATTPAEPPAPSTRPTTAQPSSTEAAPAAQAAAPAPHEGAAPPAASHQTGLLWEASGTIAAALIAVELVRRRRHSLQRRLAPRSTVAAGPPRHPNSGAAGRQLMSPPRQADLVRIDTALRVVADQVAGWPVEDLPQITGVHTGDGAITLMLAEAAARPPAPFRADRNGWWRLDAHARLPRVADDVLAPLPSLVTAGGDGGQHVLLDLEYLRSLGIAGDPTAAMDLLRYAVLDLAHNIWADDLHITLAGFDPADAQALRSADPGRIRVASSIGQAIDGYRRRLSRPDPQAANHVLAIAEPQPGDLDLIGALDGELHATTGTGISMIVAPAAGLRLGHQITLTPDGLLDTGLIGTPIRAAALPADMVGKVIAFVADQAARGVTTPIDVARAASQQARSRSGQRPVSVAGQHRRAKDAPKPSWTDQGADLMRARHTRAVW